MFGEIMRVLIVDNNLKTLDFLSNILGKEGFTVTSSDTGHGGLAQFRAEPPDFICLDIMMPDISGYDVCKEIRKTNEEIPIIFISAKNNISDKIVGLEVGADDYITKPFDIGEVIARIRAVARRSLINKKSIEEINEYFQMGDLFIYPKKLKAQREGMDIDLSLREINILTILHQNKNNVVNKDALLDFCWGMHIMPESRTVAWHISQLRKRVEIDTKNPSLIKTVHGVGYKYEE